MKDLLDKIQKEHNISPEQTKAILNTITDYLKEKFPMVRGAIDNFFQSGTTPSSPGTTPGQVQTPHDSSAPNQADLMDKISGIFGKK